MTRMLQAVVVLCATLVVAAQQAPTISKIEPAAGPASGGTEVTISGTNLDTKILCILPCPPHVVFGDVSVEPKSQTATYMVVETPAHPAGVVDVTIAIPGEEPVKLPHAFTFVAGYDDAYEQVLLPVYLDGPVPGAFGSVWRTDFWLRNDSQGPVALAPWPCPPGLACPPVYPLTKLLMPGESLHNLDPYYRAPGANPSRLLYVSKPEVSMSLRVADPSRSTMNAGTEIPVVREGEMHSGKIQLLDVPLNAEFRVLLRVYETAYTDASFAVRLYDQSDLAGTSAPVHSASVSTTTSQRADFRTEAAYGELDVSALLRLPKPLPSSVRIEIEPLRAGSRAWAFASITSNATQLVTVATPR